MVEIVALYRSTVNQLVDRLSSLLVYKTTLPTEEFYLKYQLKYNFSAHFNVNANNLEEFDNVSRMLN